MRAREWVCGGVLTVMAALPNQSAAAGTYWKFVERSYGDFIEVSKVANNKGEFLLDHMGKKVKVIGIFNRASVASDASSVTVYVTGGSNLDGGQKMALEMFGGQGAANGMGLDIAMSEGGVNCVVTDKTLMKRFVRLQPGTPVGVMGVVAQGANNFIALKNCTIVNNSSYGNKSPLAVMEGRWCEFGTTYNTVGSKKDYAQDPWAMYEFRREGPRIGYKMVIQNDKKNGWRNDIASSPWVGAWNVPKQGSDWVETSSRMRYFVFLDEDTMITTDSLKNRRHKPTYKRCEPK